jgi:hypothetical protein
MQWGQALQLIEDSGVDGKQPVPLVVEAGDEIELIVRFSEDNAVMQFQATKAKPAGTLANAAPTLASAADTVTATAATGSGGGDDGGGGSTVGGEKE